MAGQIVVVVAAKSGCGATTIAVNIAVVLRNRGLRVCVLDLDTRFGDVAGVLNLPRTRTISGSIGHDHLDADVLGEIIAPHLSGVDCVLAPDKPGEAGQVTPTVVTKVLRLLSDSYDAVVVDTAGGLSAIAVAALDMAHRHIVVSTPELPALRGLRDVLDTLDLLGQPRDMRSVILNRSDATTSISAAQADGIVRSPIAAHIPSSRDVA
ncbi:MAG: Type secretion system ATPase TadZ/CpaE, associated with Flp pilus assembly, partial [Jatrophihabitantaceae bacterium]|nr:Type secretion system ATPase TadZ/CpaE, associated with Flp pilus assembly [Jatrophihabitantaceae bacterium]